MDKFIVSSSPHINGKQYTSVIMRDVLISLIPPVVAGVIFFGFRALILVLVSMLSAAAFESLWNRILKKEDTIGDLSACVTGALLALILPVNAPLWLPVIGSLFAIVFCKGMFGGLGQNFINPALGGRAFLLASWPVLTTVFAKPYAKLPLLSGTIPPDAISSATPLAIVKSAEIADYSNLMPLFVGNVPGCIGETSAIAILIGLIYLLARKVITIEAPLSYILSVGFFGYLMGYNGSFTGNFLFSVLSGGVLFGGVYMITDYVTTPASKKGRIVAGIIAGFMTVLIRVRGGYPEGVTYSIMFINVLTPLIDKFIVPRKYGKISKKLFGKGGKKSEC